MSCCLFVFCVVIFLSLFLFLSFWRVFSAFLCFYIFVFLLFCLFVCLYFFLFVFLSRHRADEMSEDSKVMKVTPCVKILKWQSVSE